MSAPPISRDRAVEEIAAVNKRIRAGNTPKGIQAKAGEKGAVAAAAEDLGTPRNSLNYRLSRYKELYDLDPDWEMQSDAQAAEPLVPHHIDYHAMVRQALRKGNPTLEMLSEITGLPGALCSAIITDLHSEGINVKVTHDTFTIDTSPPPAFVHGPQFEYVSRDDNTFLFGAVGDTHLGSKYAREDVLEEEYDRFAEAGVDRVFHTGNWIDGEARFNKHDLTVHGMDAQCSYLSKHYPQRDGITTYAVAGDDHEGWYAQREGVDIGRYAEQTFRDAGREDWVDLGYMESHIVLKNANTGKAAIMAVVHPGGGSAYAESYAIQKIVESLEGGEKPGVALYGHYHKLLAGEYRNVWWLQTGCMQDQTPFARKRKLRFTIGGSVVKLTQDPETGAITGFVPDMRRYFNRGYYQGRWSMSGDVALPERTP